MSFYHIQILLHSVYQALVYDVNTTLLLKTPKILLKYGMLVILKWPQFCIFKIKFSQFSIIKSYWRRIPSLSIRRQYDFIIENYENFILKMQYWGHFKITCIPYFNKISPATLIFFGLNISIFRILGVSISVTGAPGDPKIFFWDIHI